MLTRILYIFWREYWGNITRRSYLIFSFGFPLFMVTVPIIGGIILAFVIRSALPPTDPRPIGIVDQVELFAETDIPPHNDPVEVVFFADPQSAATALEKGDIQAYYNIRPDYWETGEIKLTYDVAPTEQVDTMFVSLVRTQVRAKAPSNILTRLDHGPNITHYGVNGGTSFNETDIIEPVIVYLVLYFVRLAGSFTASYMFDSIASEARDRTLEILITSVSPFQFVTGKLFGLLAVGLTQIAAWGAAILIFAVGGSLLLNVDLVGFLLGWEHLGLMVNVLLATYLMDQILAAAMGLLRVSGGAGNLLFSTINSVVGISLIYAAYFIPRNPDTPVAVIASLFPVTAPLVLLIRVVVSDVPTWQIVLSQIFLWGTNVLGLFWLRRLLKTNLVANNSTSFRLRDWLHERLVVLRAWIPLRQ